MKKDKTILCVECNQEFVWTVGEQEFYASRKIEEPQNCMICRAKKQAERLFWQRSN